MRRKVVLSAIDGRLLEVQKVLNEHSDKGGKLNLEGGFVKEDKGRIIPLEEAVSRIERDVKIYNKVPVVKKLQGDECVILNPNLWIRLLKVPEASMTKTTRW